MAAFFCLSTGATVDPGELGQRQAFRHHPFFQVLARHDAPADDALIAVAAQVLARHEPAGDLIGKCVGRILAALPGLAVQAAELPALGRVDPVQADSLAVYFNGIAVDHRGDTGHVGGPGWRAVTGR